jgi:hypothetical protein
LQTGGTPGGPEVEQHHLAALVLQATRLLAEIWQLEIGGRLGLIDNPQARRLHQGRYRGGHHGLAIQEYDQPYHHCLWWHNG